MFKYPKYEMDISRHVRVADLGWPEPGEAAAESGLGCNRAYMDLRRLAWTNARKTLADEARLIARIENAEDLDDEYYSIEVR